MVYDDIKYLALDLPEDILKEKWSGNFERARDLISRRLSDDRILRPLKCRLELELKNLDFLESCYTLTKDELMEEIRSHIPDFTDCEFEKLRKENKIDWIYLEGSTRFLNSSCDTLLKVYPELWNRAGGDASDYSKMQEIISDAEDGHELACHIHIRQDLDILDAREGENIKVHLPLPCGCAEVRNFKLLNCTPEWKALPDKADMQPAVYFESNTSETTKFSVEYEMDTFTTYIDMAAVNLEKVGSAEIPEDAKQYLGEELPHIQFTPYLRFLADELAGDVANPLLKARRFYDFITTETDYRFVREYGCIDNLPQYCALNYRGDCGLQALLFISLCRISGIPARWQSGLDAKPGDVGEHDWVRFYVPSLGWRYADLSYGGSSYIRGALDRWNFFFGNIDPYRIPINNAFQHDFAVKKRYLRQDPYDNQCGEAEYDDCGIYNEHLDYTYTEIDIHRIK